MAKLELITSVRNPRVQMARALLDKARSRAEANAFVVEGVRLVEEALHAGWETRLVFYAEQLSPRGAEVVRAYQASGVETLPVAESVMSALSGTETPQGICAVVEMKSLPALDQLDFALVCDTVRDPGNLGTLLRTAAAAGVQAVILPPETADPYAPKVVRAGMGAHFHVAILRLDWPEIRRLLLERRPPLKVVETDASAQRTLWEADLSGPLALLIGGEAEGASAQGQALAQERIRIPMPGSAESLNAAIAAGIVLFEALRQRTAIHPAT